MVEFETIDSTEVKFGNNNFIEVGKKKAVTEEGENEFISLSRGFFTQDGQKRYKKNFALPNDADVVSQIIEALQNLNIAESPKQAAKEEEPAEESDEEEEEEKD
ncbi:MAG: hypothetical protein JSV92_01625 [archaeon]|nr:MAG: hypothetical protein JSV92_01625 [archaeon]